MSTPINPLQLFKALADETRLHCVLLITAEQELCVCELMQAVDQPQPKVSRHLAQLKRIGLLRDRRQGQWVFYRLDPDLPDWAKAIINNAFEYAPATYVTAMDRLHAMGERPARSRNCCA